MRSRNLWKNTGRFLQGMLCGVCVTALGLAGVEIFDYAEVTKAQSASELNLDLKSNSRKIKKIEDIINEYFYEDVDSEQVEDYIYKGMIAGLDDKYAAYYTQEELAGCRSPQMESMTALA